MRPKNLSDNTLTACITLASAFLTLITFTCTSGNRNTFTFNPAASSGDTLVVWAHSDIQPKRISQRSYYESAIADTKQTFKKTDIALMAGNIIFHKNSGSVYRWYLDQKKKSGIPRWYEIPGNTDMNDIANFRKLVRSDTHYAASAGNILFLFMGDEDTEPSQFISDSTFRWWKKNVEGGGDKIIVTVTHGCLEQSGLFGAISPDSTIRNSRRFAEVLKKHRVDIWISGGTHIPNFFNGKMKEQEELGGTLFINAASITKELPSGVESAFLVFRENSRDCLIMLRNHEYKRFDKKYNLRHALSRPFIRNSAH
ncbi:MAG TPA: metallophosphoesterase [Spirochaetota bacterium]|nr:metallophosphoesterase [Spirochaetota bacterium]